MKQPKVIKVLDLSTVHIPVPLRRVLAQTDGLFAHEHDEDGYLMWVPEYPVIYALEQMTPPPSDIVKIQMFARDLECDYVLFDRGGDIIRDLPQWD